MLKIIQIRCNIELNLDEDVRMLDMAINNDIDPCDDFYDYVCGAWNETTQMPYYYSVWDVYEMSKDIIIKKIRDILEDVNSYSNRNLLAKERQFYNACMDLEYSRERGINVYKVMVEKSQAEGPKWQNVAEFYANKIGEISLFHVTLGPKNKLEIIRPSNTISNIHPFQEVIEYIDLYLENTDNSLWFNEMRSTDPLFKKSFIEFVELMSRIVSGTNWPLIPVTIDRFERMYKDSCLVPNPITQINWLRFLKKLAGPAGDMLTYSHIIYIDWSYLRTLCNTLSSVSNDVIVRYLQFNFEMDENIFFYLSQQLPEMMFGERSYNCILEMPLSTGYSNVLSTKENIFTKISYIPKLLKNLKSELGTQILNSWFDEGLQSKAMSVLNELQLWLSNMGIPMAKNEIESISYNFKVTDCALENLINFKKAQTIHKFNLFLSSTGTRRSKRDIQMNAFYHNRRNLMVMSPAFLFPPFFHENASIAYIYGRLGFTIGHEISHAFDYDRLYPIHGYIPENKDKFRYIATQKLKCFIDQFEYLNEGSGFGTLYENVADTQGLKLAFSAMRRQIESHIEAPNEALRNLYDVEINKLFFKAFANVYCEIREEPFETTSHSPSKARVIGTLQNMDEFAETFNCARGKPMNPRRERCDFWKN